MCVAAIYGDSFENSLFYNPDLSSNDFLLFAPSKKDTL